MKQLSALLLFYRHYCGITLVVTAACCLLYLHQPDIILQVVTKLFTTAVVIFFITALHRDKLYYYYNLHLSKRLLFTSYVLADLIIFSTCLWLTNLMLR